MQEYLQQVMHWRFLLIALIVFGFAPGAVLRFVLLAYPPDSMRRQELLAELYAMPTYFRPIWVAQQFETALFEGLPLRFGSWRRSRSDALIASYVAEMEAMPALFGACMEAVITADVLDPTAVRRLRVQLRKMRKQSRRMLREFPRDAEAAVFTQLYRSTTSLFETADDVVASLGEAMAARQMIEDLADRTGVCWASVAADFSVSGSDTSVD